MVSLRMYLSSVLRSSRLPAGYEQVTAVLNRLFRYINNALKLGDDLRYFITFLHVAKMPRKTLRGRLNELQEQHGLLKGRLDRVERSHEQFVQGRLLGPGTAGRSVAVKRTEAEFYYGLAELKKKLAETDANIKVASRILEEL